MDIYRFCLYVGFTGIACMAVLGIGHLGFGHGTHGGSHDGHSGGHAGGHGADHAGHGAAHAGAHGHGATHDGGHAHGQHGHAHSHGHDAGDRFDALLGFLSPRVFFSLLLGFGASGVLLKQALTMEPHRLILALCGGLLFEKLFVQPLWNLVFRFASNPARTLESAVCEEARAVTDFDARGHGLIAIELDGRMLQVLGTLTAQNRAEGTRVRSGDRVFIEAVDPQRNSCTVSRLVS